MTNWKDKKVAVLGLGVEGLSNVRFLIKKEAQVTILDKKGEKELEKDTQKLNTYSSSERSESRSSNAAMKQLNNEDSSGLTSFARTITFLGGEHYLKNLSQYDIIVRSPGVKRNLPEILNAEKKGSFITSQIKIFFDLCPSPIIGVTGTKGKGTTATLIYEMLKKSFDSARDKNVYLGGNIGKPPFDFLDKLNEHSIVVLELSSFQLQDLTKSPHIAVMLMTTSEHLDYHKDVYEYVDAKRNILRFQKASDFAIINKDYLASRESDVLTQGKVFEVSREGEVGEGCFVKNGRVVVRSALGSLRQFGDSSNPNVSQGSDIARAKFSKIETQDSLFKSSPHAKAPHALLYETIIDIKDILLPGKHNLENVCAAVMAATIVGVSKENIVKVLKTFKGLEHRLELIGEVNGVKYYDDSFSTTPETAIAAIEAFKSPEILILGGSSKGSDFTELGHVINNAKNIKAIIGIGKEWHKIKSKINPSTTLRARNQKSKIIGVNKHLEGGRMDSFEVDSMAIIGIEGCRSMQEIVQAAVKIARPGDVVLLSPACASFDMFKNYKDRGEQFKEQVLKLKIM